MATAAPPAAVDEGARMRVRGAWAGAGRAGAGRVVETGPALLPERAKGSSLFFALRDACRVAADAVANVFAPADCRACGGPLLEARGFAVCAMCVARLRAEAEAVCSRCGERLPWEDAAGAGFGTQDAVVCGQCAEDPPQFVRATAFAAYDGTLRTLIRLHKFEGMPELAGLLGRRLMAVLGAVSDEVPGVPLHVVAVPLFRKRRRYNQSIQIADVAVRALRRAGVGERLLLSHRALRRVRATQSQSHLTPAQRRDNVRGAFAVCGDVTGWTVLLVDDVYTTGATAAECTRMLLRAGAAAVHVVTLARTQPDGAVRWERPEEWSGTRA